MHGGVVVPGEVALAGPLHLDHPGAEVGELPGGVGRGHGLFQTDYRDPRQGMFPHARASAPGGIIRPGSFD
ncbi:hypothetical protein GCM10009601_22380 [Streptomyces thermospinosisporus]|uniref:Uncharacterized protein n=1 Tax=Streptomyces thermospinosisporus TaxID=161482 RepID=A0ABN1YSZ1_9ACTN